MLEWEVKRWIEAVLQEPFPDDQLYEDVLQDGIILCRLMNMLSPGSIPKMVSNRYNGYHFKSMENVTRFQNALVEFGVDKADIFQTNDLSEKEDIANVTNTLFALGRVVSEKS